MTVSQPLRYANPQGRKTISVHVWHNRFEEPEPYKVVQNLPAGSRIIRDGLDTFELCAAILPSCEEDH